MPFPRLHALPLLTALLLPLGCHAQQPAATATQNAPAASLGGKPLSPELQRKIEVTLRQKANLPPETTVQVGGANPSEFPSFDTVNVTVTNDGRTSKPITFLLSHDGKTLAQLTKFDISADPKDLVSGADRPFRGGPVTAPVLIVGFDDLECPYCARLHKEIFPAITERYGDKVRIVYRDYPLEMHPWAMHAAIDTDCLADQSNGAYWSAVDYIHAHAGEIGADPKDAKAEKTLPRATEQLDEITRKQGEAQKVDMPKLNACLAKQDPAEVNVSKVMGTKLNLEATPTLYVNGAKVDGAVSLSFLYGVIDQALRVAGVQPPPPYVAPAPGPAAPTGR